MLRVISLGWGIAMADFGSGGTNSRTFMRNTRSDVKVKPTERRKRLVRAASAISSSLMRVALENSMCSRRQRLKVWCWINPVLRLDLALQFLSGALPVREVATIRPSFLDPDAIGTFPNVTLEQAKVDHQRTIL